MSTNTQRAEGKYLVFNSWGLENVSHRFFLRYFRFLTSLVRVFLSILSLIFNFWFFNDVPCDLKQCSINQIQSKCYGLVHGFNGGYKWFIQTLPCNQEIFL